MIETIKPTFQTAEEKVQLLTVINNISKILLSSQHLHSSVIIACLHCKKNLLFHSQIQIANVAYRIFFDMISKNEQFPHNLLNIVCGEMISVRSLECPIQNFFSTTLKTHLSSFLSLKQSKFASVLVSLLHMICEKSNEIGSVSEHIKDDDFYESLWYSTHFASEKCIVKMRAQYLRVINIMARPDFPGPKTDILLKPVLHHLCHNQNELEKMFDIADELEAMNWTYKKAIPISRIDNVQLLLQVLQYASLNANTLKDNMQIMLINRIIELSTTIDQRLNCLRALNTYLTIPMPQEVYEKLRALFTNMKQEQHSIPLKEKYRWYSIIATMEYTDYMRCYIETVEQNKSEPVDFKKTENLRLFGQINLEKEASVVRKLQSSLVWYSKFINKLGVEACKHEYLWEVEGALQHLRKIGEHLMLRMYREDAMNAYRWLFGLSRKIGDEFQQLQAIGYLSANSREYVSTDSQLSLDQIVEIGCEIFIRLLKIYDKLSPRKQRILCHFTMNVSLFYVESGKVSDAKELLRFTETMLNSMEAKMPDEDVLVRIRYNSILFSLCTKFGLHCPFPPIRLAELVIKSSVKLRTINADEMTLWPILLFESLHDITRYSLARFDFEEGELCMAILFKMALRAECAYKSALLLSLWALLDLYKENETSFSVSYE